MGIKLFIDIKIKTADTHNIFAQNILRLLQQQKKHSFIGIKLFIDIKIKTADTQYICFKNTAFASRTDETLIHGH